ncbi:MAG: DUF6478 family protein [Pseudomonadota bacterium]
MAFQGPSFLDKRRLVRAARRTAELTLGAERMSGGALALAESDVERLRQRLDAAARAAEAARAALAAASPVPGPEHCDFAHRPDLWSAPVRPRGGVEIASGTALSPDITLFHDCPSSEISFRQIRAAHGAARYHLAIEVYRFGGGFLSLVQTLPEAAVAGLTRSHFFAVTLDVDLDLPLEVYARLNLQSGPNTEQVVRELDLSRRPAVAEFDLAYTKINERRMEKVWLDLIFEAPQMNRALIRDMTVTRAPRADI